ncbi:DUF2894 domain-containing protein [Bordetella tumulicola]|uniref:DUF2894 domain-containing protein n=1 Tax=Bordetella tumulicola TaxID=1649133 RepID=UPI0039EFFB81
MTDATHSDIQAALDAWREQGADRLDPVRFQFIQAMATRAVKLEGHARKVLDARLSELLQQYRTHLDSAAASATTPRKARQDDTLSTLVNHLATLVPPGTNHLFASRVNNLRERYPELPVLDEFRATWSRVSANRQVRQSEEQVHENAGPLNSNHLVHRTLSMMRDVSPGYLHQFLSYLDTLGWVEQLQIANSPAPKERASKGAKGTKATKSTKKTHSGARKIPKKPA